MKISTLLKREPFDKIFEKTISSFLKDFTNCSYSVKWETKRKFNYLSDSTQQWYCNPLINSVFEKNVNPAAFNSINGEYSYNPLRPWRSAIQRMYLSLSQSKITAVLMSKYIVKVSPPIEDAENKLILGGNTKIRLIDIVDNNVYVILKDGFDKKYLEREIYVRTNFSYLPIPKIKAYGSNSLWYCEEYISGVPPNRMKGNRGKEILLEAVIYIHRILNETKKKVSLSEYAVSLQVRINGGVEQLSYIDDNVKRDIKYITSTLTAYLEKYSDKLITIAYCHGDFHQGNILSNGEKFWILDWENSGQKQIGYDLFILLLESRIESGFSNRFSKLLNNQFDSFQQELINNWPNINWNNEESKKIILLIFLLEELEYHIKENTNHMFYENPNVIEYRYIELEKCFASIINNT